MSSALRSVSYWPVNKWYAVNEVVPSGQCLWYFVLQMKQDKSDFFQIFMTAITHRLFQIESNLLSDSNTCAQFGKGMKTYSSNCRYSRSKPFNDINWICIQSWYTLSTHAVKRAEILRFFRIYIFLSLRNRRHSSVWTGKKNLRNIFVS